MRRVADYVVVHAPVLSFFKAQDETLKTVKKIITDAVDIGVAL